MPRLTAPPTPVQVKAGDASKAPPAWFVKGENVIYKTPIHYPPHQRCVEVRCEENGAERSESEVLWAEGREGRAGSGTE